MPVQIHEANRTQWAVVADITLEANQQYAATADKNFWTEYEKHTRDLLMTEPDIVRLIALCDGEIAASVVLCPPYDRTLGNQRIVNPYTEMRLLSVLPQFRNRGIANVLIEACEDRVRANGESAISLHTTHLMAIAKGMYERRGYTRFPQIDFEPAPGFIVWGYKKDFSSESK